MPPIIGIDLGTTNSLMAYVDYRRVEGLFGRPARGGLDPDEVVAMGAAVQASILEGECADVLVLDA
ncbi:MAG: Hsp70 family protein [Candidatus Rokuibacteriota bacterium]